jgi:hypothetical protein
MIITSTCRPTRSYFPMAARCMEPTETKASEETTCSALATCLQTSACKVTSVVATNSQYTVFVGDIDWLAWPSWSRLTSSRWLAHFGNQTGRTFPCILLLANGCYDIECICTMNLPPLELFSFDKFPRQQLLLERCSGFQRDPSALHASWDQS